MIFLDELQKPAKYAFGLASHAIIEQFMFAKMPHHLKEFKNQANLENGTYWKIVTHLEREFKLNGLKVLGELKVSTVSLHATQSISEKPKRTEHHCNKTRKLKNQRCQLGQQSEQAVDTKNRSVKKGGTHKLELNTSNKNSNSNKKMTENQILFTLPVRHVEKKPFPREMLLCS